MRRGGRGEEGRDVKWSLCREWCFAEVIIDFYYVTFPHANEGASSIEVRFFGGCKTKKFFLWSFLQHLVVLHLWFQQLYGLCSVTCSNCISSNNYKGKCLCIYPLMSALVQKVVIPAQVEHILIHWFSKNNVCVLIYACELVWSESM